jgi:hypothetical protein
MVRFYIYVQYAFMQCICLLGFNLGINTAEKDPHNGVSQWCSEDYHVREDRIVWIVKLV